MEFSNLESPKSKNGKISVSNLKMPIRISHALMMKRELFRISSITTFATQMNSLEISLNMNKNLTE